eukprot:TRINITY_DN21486_c0_g1_i1.p1 TRINITY_DN21486_c0_g1~~TRINITY_DN21486_c0_g1_i1.p1  ORF type:complete len:276 (+),score=80.87 TRINITY_DN21486_c0_g1_i1:75-830(+)
MAASRTSTLECLAKFQASAEGGSRSVSLVQQSIGRLQAAEVNVRRTRSELDEHVEKLEKFKQAQQGARTPPAATGPPKSPLVGASVVASPEQQDDDQLLQQFDRNMDYVTHLHALAQGTDGAASQRQSALAESQAALDDTRKRLRKRYSAVLRDLEVADTGTYLTGKGPRDDALRESAPPLPVCSADQRLMLHEIHKRIGDENTVYELAGKVAINLETSVFNASPGRSTSRTKRGGKAVSTHPAHTPFCLG